MRHLGIGRHCRRQAALLRTPRFFVVAGLVPAIIGIAIETSQTRGDGTGYSTLRSGGPCTRRSVSSHTGCDATSVGTT